MLMTRGGCRPFPVRIPLLALFHQNFIVFGSVLVYSAYLKSRETMNKSPERPRRGRSGRAGYGHLACRWLGK